MRQVILFVSLMLATWVSAQDFRPVKGGCLPDLDEAVASRSGAPVQRRYLPARKTDWDPNKTYKQLVILLDFKENTPDDPSEVKFNREDANATYNDIFNKEGYNERNGVGCVAEYYRDQSNGKLNLSFDVFGPYMVSQKANPDKTKKNYGRDSFREATNMMIDANPTHDFSVYDWNGDGKIEQVVFVYAGVPGNLGSTTEGYIWPNTSTFTVITTPDGKKISDYTSSGELGSLKTKISCGIGTICHEFTHSLGLPDIYPAHNQSSYSVCDEWDLMDGGNFTNYGWCPPNFTSMEKYLMGWVTFEELTEPTTISGLEPVSEGGKAYRIKHSDSEWYLLENRQQRGWDAGVPGKGLVIYHVNYDGSVWDNNSVNDDSQKHRFYLVPADNLDYDAWNGKIIEDGLSQYANDNHMNSRYLSTSPYPYVVDNVVQNNQLTDTSTPAAIIYYPTGTLLGKPITNIVMDAEGKISFDFMGGTTAIKGVSVTKDGSRQYYDLSGRPVQTTVAGQLYIVKEADGTVYKYISK